MTGQNLLCANPCSGQATGTPSSGTPPYTYLWSPGGQTTATATGLCAGTYSVTITDVNGCTSVSSVTITAPSALSTSVTVINTSCAGGSNGTATTTVLGGTPGYTYLWSPTGQTTTTATGLSAGTYTCTVTDLNGCTTTQVAIVNQPPALSISTSSTNTCPGASNGTATVTAGGGTPGYTYTWIPSGQTNATATGLAGGTYTCIVTDLNGCTMSSSGVTVTTLPAPTAGATAIPPGGQPPLPVGFTGTGGGTYIWYVSNGDTLYGATPTDTFPSGTYTVMLVVTGANGCMDTTWLTILVEDVSFISVPNVFSPNGDLYNEFFHPMDVKNITQFKMDIYDRWGLLMGTVEDVNKGWNGKAKSGKDAPEGTYYYIINATGIDNKTYSFNGYFMLLRN